MRPGYRTGGQIKTCTKLAPWHSKSSAGLSAARSSGLESPNLQRWGQDAAAATRGARSPSAGRHLSCATLCSSSSCGGGAEPTLVPAQLRHRDEVVRVNALEEGAHLPGPRCDRCALGRAGAAGAPAAGGCRLSRAGRGRQAGKQAGGRCGQHGTACTAQHSAAQRTAGSPAARKRRWLGHLGIWSR